MAAMTVRVGDRSSILLSKDASYPAWIAFYLAHELAHVALGHLEPDESLIDLERHGPALEDEEEDAADAWALELLTGLPRPNVQSADGRSSARELARVAQNAAPQLAIEPGTLALAFAFSTGEWAVGTAALAHIYSEPSPVWRAVNAYASHELRLVEQSTESAAFVLGVLGLEGAD